MRRFGNVDVGLEVACNAPVSGCYVDVKGVQPIALSHDLLRGGDHGVGVHTTGIEAYRELALTGVRQLVADINDKVSRRTVGQATVWCDTDDRDASRRRIVERDAPPG